MNRKKIAFFSAHKHPSTDRALELLRTNFPNHEVVKFQMDDIFYNNLFTVFLNSVVALGEHFKALIFRKKRPSQAFITTTYIFKKGKKIAHKILQKDDYYFSFQIGSLFDFSMKGIPHFVYTDNTFKANTTNPIFDEVLLPKENWLNLERSIYDNATAVLLRSTNVVKSIIEDYSIDKRKVFNIGAGYNIPVKDSFCVDNDNYSNKNILFVATRWGLKGGPDIYEAFKIVREKHPDAKFTIVGCKPKLTDETNITLVGKLSLNDTLAYFKKASIFCVPTRLEPFGIVFIEAMRCKLPVITTNIQSIPDFIQEGKTGYMVEPGDVDAIAEHLIELLDDPEKCKAFGNAGYEFVMENYTWEKVGNKMKNRIEEYLNDFYKNNK